MFSGIVKSAKPLVWALVLLLLTTYIFGVCIMPFVAEELARPQACAVRADLCDQLMEEFGSIWRSSYTLYKAVTGGADWGDTAAPLIEITWFLGVFFSVYVAFATLCVMNIITGVFVENANRTTTQDDENMVAEEFETRKRWFEEVQQLFQTSRNETKREIDLAEFESWTVNPMIQTRFRKLGLDVDDRNARAVFNLLDIDGTGSIDFDKFALGIEQLHGHARSLDIARVRLDCKKLQRQMALVRRELVVRDEMLAPVPRGTPPEASARLPRSQI
jgi:hypothetical protein